MILPFAGKTQQQDSTHLEVDRTEIELVYGHYLQDGQHSAVTGGTGTEELRVYSSAISVKREKGKNLYGLRAGVDVISSASTDNIDFVASSASRVDARNHASLSYARQHSGALSYDVNGGFSFESDYLSLSTGAGLSYEDGKHQRSYSVNLKLYFDDLRWGRLSRGFFNPVEVVYPYELRYRDWYETYKRQSYNLRLGVVQILNKRNVLGLFSETTYQKGLLATPFHRVYFENGTLAVEQLPQERWKEGLSLRWNHFLGGFVILKNSLGGYVDNFGITAIDIEHETAFKLNAFHVLRPGIRFHTQTAARYFAPYRHHSPADEFYTSDYDLSSFQSYRAGLSWRYAINRHLLKHTDLNALELGYAFYRRSDGLQAHIFHFSLVMLIDKSGLRK